MIDRLRAIYKLWRAKKKGIHDYLAQSEATLYINKADYAYLEIDGVRYFFHNSNPRVVRYKEITTFDGEQLRQSILPYDGFEISISSPASVTNDIDTRIATQPSNTEQDKEQS